ncbi:MAG TPA: hypothetical protein VHU89_10550 [Acidobacteriaceae bacterium]|jgi:hypothetical protein|nr:hypothetical protein [Acidobacteriaceae bacterium]
MRLEAMAVHLPDVAGHPNRAPFQGVLTRVDEPSTKPPSGARGHRVILTRAAALAGLPSLLGMAIDYVPSWDGHDARRKCGIITEADVEGSRLLVAGYLFAKDFPDVERQMRQSTAGSMGMSWELADAHVEDMRQEVWTLTRATFTGAAILLREKAAYRDTSFELAASRCRSFAAHATAHPRAGLASRMTDQGKESTWNNQRAKEWTR